MEQLGKEVAKSVEMGLTKLFDKLFFYKNVKFMFQDSNSPPPLPLEPRTQITNWWE